MFGSLGMPELIFIMVLALLIFGPKRLPQVGRTLGKGLREFRQATNELKRTVETEISADDAAPIRPTPAPLPAPKPAVGADASTPAVEIETPEPAVEIEVSKPVPRSVAGGDVVEEATAKPAATPQDEAPTDVPQSD